LSAHSADGTRQALRRRSPITDTPAAVSVADG